MIEDKADKRAHSNNSKFEHRIIIKSVQANLAGYGEIMSVVYAYDGSHARINIYIYKHLIR